MDGGYGGLELDLLIEHVIEYDPAFGSLDDVEREMYLKAQAVRFRPFLQRALDDFAASELEPVPAWREQHDHHQQRH